MLANVTASISPTWAKDTPPNRIETMNSGTAAANSTSTPSRLASSLPNTNSLFDKLVSSNRISVRRSFSCATALAANTAEKKTATTNCNGARI